MDNDGNKPLPRVALQGSASGSGKVKLDRSRKSMRVCSFINTGVSQWLKTTLRVSCRVQHRERSKTYNQNTKAGGRFSGSCSVEEMIKVLPDLKLSEMGL